MSDVDWVPLVTDAVRVGDLVSTAAGGMPIWRVVAIEGGLARLQDEGRPEVRTLPLNRLLWKAAETQARTAR